MTSQYLYWDSRDMVTAYHLDEPTPTALYRYDGLGSRVSV